jgi:pimeloyl-ACP methyl ester carboxylesterase
MAQASRGPGARLPRPAEYRLLRGPLGDLVFRPWFDRVALGLVGRWYLPLSRAWAAGLASEGSIEGFWANLGRGASPGALERAWAGRLLSTLRARRAAYDHAAQAWELAFFGAQAPAAEVLVAREAARHGAAHRLMLARATALPLDLARALPPVRWEVAPPRGVAAAHGARLGAPHAAFPAPRLPEVVRSHAVPGAYGAEHWLRFRAPVLGDTAWARVYTPTGVDDPPSLIFLHGIAVETEFWRGIADAVSGLAQRGIRVVRPEGPWHGRRRPEGWYGGEPALGRGPLGLIELFQAWVAEVAVLVAWARRTSRGPVALAGVSLGALGAQLAVSAARHWPAQMSPDAGLLAATSGRLLEVAEHGSLARAIGLWPRMQAAGWDEAELERWLPLIEPRGAPGVAPERLVMLLGEADDLTPFAGGLDLARRWGVPAENLFLRPRGHFSVWFALGRDPAPLERLLALFGRG